MPEYRRFIAYFYEYINGKKQKNAGYAKVELRNGMWRILFRLTAERLPGPPVQVYGFVREAGYLLGFPLGTMRPGKEISEEWAYRAETPIGKDKYRLEDLAGIWIQGSDERYFLTVWDDDAVDPSRFVLELPNQGEEAEDRQGQMPEEEAEEDTRRQALEAVRLQPESARRDMQEQEVLVQNIPEQDIQEKDMQKQEIEREDAAGENVQEKGQDRQEPDIAFIIMEELFRKRPHFQPFSDDEITSCVMIRPCDVIRLQQGRWKVGRSSFLQHGFYQHRHLLLGMARSGEYVLGVPGIKNPQEQYMARMFGFDRFKVSGSCECNKVFGYWYRILSVT